MVEFLWVPLLACLVLTAIHVYLGLHVLARGVIFVDLALAQVAALGVTVAFLAGHPIQSEAAYWYALAFTLGGAALFAGSRARRAPVPQEAIIGIVYAVSAAAAMLVVDRAPQGTGRAGERGRARRVVDLGPADRRHRGRRVRRGAGRPRRRARGAGGRAGDAGAGRRRAPRRGDRAVRRGGARGPPAAPRSADGPLVARLAGGDDSRCPLAVPERRRAQSAPRQRGGRPAERRRARACPRDATRGAVGRSAGVGGHAGADATVSGRAGRAARRRSDGPGHAAGARAGAPAVVDRSAARGPRRRRRWCPGAPPTGYVAV